MICENAHTHKFILSFTLTEVGPASMASNLIQAPLHLNTNNVHRLYRTMMYHFTCIRDKSPNMHTNNPNRNYLVDLGIEHRFMPVTFKIGTRCEQRDSQEYQINQKIIVQQCTLLKFARFFPVKTYEWLYYE